MMKKMFFTLSLMALTTLSSQAVGMPGSLLSQVFTSSTDVST